MRNAEPEKLAESYRYCVEVARREARNFFYGFRLLPRAKREALCGLYAFMREVDDIADGPKGKLGEADGRREALRAQRAEMDRVLSGGDAEGSVWPAFRDTMERYSISPLVLHDFISGAEMDQTPQEYETLDALCRYCYCVAGTVGLACLPVFGFSDPRAPEMAEKLGIAFQLTNILRDVPGDLAMGRIYLPREDMRQCGAREDDLRAGRFTPEWRELIRWEAARAREFYREGWGLIRLIDADSRAALWALARIYLGILERIEARDYDVFAAPPPRVSTAGKLWVLARARFQWSGEVNALRVRDRDGRRAGGPLIGRRAG